MKAKRSTLKMKYVVKERENPLLFMTRIMNQWWWTKQTWTSEFQDYHIPLWNTRKVTAFDNWFRKLRNHPNRHALQQDLRQNQSFNSFSVQNQNKWFRMLGTSDYVNSSRRKQKRSAQYVYHSGTLVYSTAHAGISGTKKAGRISNSSIIRWTFFQFLSTSSRKDDLVVDIHLVKIRERGNTLRFTSWRKDARKSFSKESMIDS